MTLEIPEEASKQYYEFIEFRSALSNESDRGCALFAAAYLDSALEGLLLASLIENKKSREELFEGSSPLATFSGRIKLAWYLGFISKEFRTDLEAIRKIRNEFAHSAANLSFETQSISDKCRNLGFSYHEADARPRAHFTAAASGLVSTIHSLERKAKRPAAMPDDRPSDEKKAEIRARARAAFAAEHRMSTDQK
ncbi:MltR family transcriptional regulator [Xylophilus ampelinus]|uniref:MltR family transcriptional regulator n=1 Tax=Xylophilus ampelinus TaxID=54067 RepID=UPI000D7B98B2|nr:MltR family transcriptional regulator [Xylophilus ampelinus]MCS4508897.1 hypothetical protein [Xylophilus ampelinus]